MNMIPVYSRVNYLNKLWKMSEIIGNSLSPNNDIIWELVYTTRVIWK